MPPGNITMDEERVKLGEWIDAGAVMNRCYELCAKNRGWK